MWEITQNKELRDEEDVYIKEIAVNDEDRKTELTISAVWNLNKCQKIIFESLMNILLFWTFLNKAL